MDVINQIKSESVQSANKDSDKMETEKKGSEIVKGQNKVTIQLGSDDELSVKVLKKQKVTEFATTAFSSASSAVNVAAAVVAPTTETANSV
eukprot:6232946-Amphidinium_carterae.1